MKKYLYLALAVFAMTACTNEGDINTPSNQKEIGFNASIRNTTRAADGYCNNNRPSELQVWACVEGEDGNYKPYFNDEKYSFVEGSESYYTSDLKRYWPNKNLRFFAFPSKHSSCISNCQWTADGTTLELDWSNPGSASKNVDFIYASSGDILGGEEFNGSYYAPLNFRHALAQIEFKAATTADDYYVEVYAVGFTQIFNKGHYVFPIDTYDYYDGHNEFAGNEYRTNRGTWSNLSSPGMVRIDLPTISFVKNDGTVSLTEKDTETYLDATDAGTASGKNIAKEYNKNTLYVIPQDPRGSNRMIQLAFNVWKMSDPSKGHQATDTRIFPRGDTGYGVQNFAIPNEWVEGKHYIYTITINPSDELKFSLNVDDFDISSNEVVTY